MPIATTYHDKLLEICQEIIDHGFGEMRFNVYSMTDDRVKVVINAGRSWVFFITKSIPFDKENIL